MTEGLAAGAPLALDLLDEIATLQAQLQRFVMC